MSLFWRIITAFFLVILLTILLSAGVAIFSSRTYVDSVTNQIGNEEARFLSNYLSREYTQSAGWELLDPTLEQIKFSSGAADSTSQPSIRLLGSNLSNDQVAVSYLGIWSRIIVTDLNDVVLSDTANRADTGEALHGEIYNDNPNVYKKFVINYQNLEPVGVVYGFITPSYFQFDSRDSFIPTLRTIGLGGGLTLLIVSFFGFWFAQYITTPVVSLTEATEKIAGQDKPVRLPVSSGDELGKMSASFNKMIESLEEQHEIRGRLIDNISHELNTPLTVIQLEAVGLIDELKLPKAAAQQIVQEVSKLRHLVYDLNWLTHPEDDEFQLDLEPTDIQDVIEAEVARWAFLAENNQVDLRFEPAGDLPIISADPVRMSQLLGNLLRNALHHTNPGARVVVTAETLKSDDSPVLKLGVTDTGIGIDPEDLPYIFDRFYRTDLSQNRNKGGRGLGLAISRAIVEGHGGEISISSEGLGKGTAVRVTLPMG